MPPSNDAFADRILLPARGSVSWDTAGATVEAGEPEEFDATGGTIWYEWVCPDHVPTTITGWDYFLGRPFEMAFTINVVQNGGWFQTVLTNIGHPGDRYYICVSSSVDGYSWVSLYVAAAGPQFEASDVTDLSSWNTFQSIQDADSNDTTAGKFRFGLLVPGSAWEQPEDRWTGFSGVSLYEIGTVWDSGGITGTTFYWDTFADVIGHRESFVYEGLRPGYGVLVGTTEIYHAPVTAAAMYNVNPSGPIPDNLVMVAYDGSGTPLPDEYGVWIPAEGNFKSGPVSNPELLSHGIKMVSASDTSLSLFSPARLQRVENLAVTYDGSFAPDPDSLETGVDLLTWPTAVTGPTGLGGRTYIALTDITSDIEVGGPDSSGNIQLVLQVDNPIETGSGGQVMLWWFSPGYVGASRTAPPLNIAFRPPKTQWLIWPGESPPMRQRHRDDGLTTDSRQEKGDGGSQQTSIRQGGRVYY